MNGVIPVRSNHLVRPDRRHERDRSVGKPVREPHAHAEHEHAEPVKMLVPVIPPTFYAAGVNYASTSPRWRIAGREAGVPAERRRRLPRTMR